MALDAFVQFATPDHILVGSYFTADGSAIGDDLGDNFVNDVADFVAPVLGGEVSAHPDDKHSSSLDGWSRLLQFKYDFSEEEGGGIFSIDKATDAATAALYGIYFQFVLKPKLDAAQQVPLKTWQFKTIRIALCRMESRYNVAGDQAAVINSRTRFAKYTFKNCKVLAMDTTVGSDGAHVDNIEVAFETMSLRYGHHVKKGKGFLGLDYASRNTFYWDFLSNNAERRQ
jgi:hypothetical protein